MFHIIDDNDSRHKILSDIILDHLQKNSSFIILIDLDYSWNGNNKYFSEIKSNSTESQLNKLIIIKDLIEINELIKFLKNLKNKEFFKRNHLLNLNLGMILIDNISIYYWKMKNNQNYPMEYKILLQVIKSLQKFFNCIVVLTSLNNFFESGLINFENLNNVNKILKFNSILQSSLQNDKIFGKLYINDEIISINQTSSI